MRSVRFVNIEIIFQAVDSDAAEALAQRIGYESCLYENLGHSAYEEAKVFNQRVHSPQKWNMVMRAALQVHRDDLY